ncbi:hypothetical protein CLM62_41075 [Streptomyces sp. SA15]|nr:hypothetical protein CLM62_41075 [Streptomyces sp. SA15]
MGIGGPGFSPPPPLPVPSQGRCPFAPARGLRPLDPHRPERPRPQTPDGLIWCTSRPTETGGGWA